MELHNHNRAARSTRAGLAMVSLLGALLFAPALWLDAGSARAQTLAEQDDFLQKSYSALSSKNYAALEKSLQPHLDAYANRRISAEELAWRFDVFSRMTEVEARFDEWVRAYPDSYSARLARGVFHVNEAWRQRGEMMGDRTSDAQMKGFNENLKKAKADLLSSIPLYARPVDSYRYLIRIAKGLGTGNERDMLDKALALDPAAYDARTEYFDAITPRWGGSGPEMARFLEECNKSRMSDKDKKRIEGIYYYALAQDARLQKDYQAGSDYFYKYYLTDKQPNILLWSAQVALDGKLSDLALKRLNQSVKTHPDYPYSYELRAQLYEYHYKDNPQAIRDYLSAADRGADWSQNHLGWYYMKGIGVPVDLVKARHYLDLAVKQGDPTATENLALLKKLEQGK